MSLHVSLRIRLSTLPRPVLIRKVGEDIKHTVRNQDPLPSGPVPMAPPLIRPAMQKAAQFVPLTS
jgi:hypothetical protein